MWRINRMMQGAGCVLGAFWFAVSCGVPGKTTMREAQELPGNYRTEAGSTEAQHEAMARIPYERFFQDKELVQLADKVLQQNPDRLMALQRMRMSGALLAERRGALLPSLSAQSRAGGTRFGKYTIDGVGNFDTNLSPNIDDDQKAPVSPTPDMWLGLHASWELDVWGRLRNLKKAARLRYLASEEGARLITSALVAQTAAFYYELVALDRELEIILENIGLQEKALAIVEVQKEGGRATELAVQQFRAQLLRTRAVEFEIRRRMAETENALAALMGEYNMPIPRNRIVHPDSLYVVQAGVPAELLTNRPDIRMAQLDMAAANADIAAARAAFFPALTLSAYTAYAAFNPSLWLAPASLGYQFLGGLTAPLFQRNEIRSRFRIASATGEEAFQQYRKQVFQAYREVQSSLNNIENNRKVYQLKTEEAGALTRSVELSHDLYLTGYANYLEIISAQTSKLDAQLQLVQTQQQIMMSVIELYRSLGGGWKGQAAE